MFEKSVFFSETLTLPADRGMPVSLYANLRQLFPESLLLECLEYDSAETARSYICADPVLTFTIQDSKLHIDREGRRVQEIDLKTNAAELFEDFQASVEIEKLDGTARELAGFFGYAAFSAIPHFEDIEFHAKPSVDEQIPDIRFALYRYVIRIDHFRNKMTLLKLTNSANAADLSLPLTDLVEKISFRRAPEYDFKRNSDEIADISDEQFAGNVRECQKHIRRGDVYQIVPSRKYVQGYSGDEFQVYRALRQINPSPFLFFFDYGNFSLFGSSPEAQILVRDRVATLHPIAGTYPRGKNAAEDKEFAARLSDDPKESAEHVMLVDLARNDLGRNCTDVKVESFKQVEFFSHVIHLVSRVSGRLSDEASTVQVMADTFPAGTLSGAPKYRALQLLNEIETSGRSFYGGSVGFFGIDGDCTQAIMIRSFLARNRKLIFQAGAGIVHDSDPKTETVEVRNKLGALRRAIEMAEGEAGRPE